MSPVGTALVLLPPSPSKVTKGSRHARAEVNTYKDLACALRRPTLRKPWAIPDSRRPVNHHLFTVFAVTGWVWLRCPPHHEWCS